MAPFNNAAPPLLSCCQCGTQIHNILPINTILCPNPACQHPFCDGCEHIGHNGLSYNDYQVQVDGVMSDVPQNSYDPFKPSSTPDLPTMDPRVMSLSPPHTPLIPDPHDYSYLDMGEGNETNSDEPACCFCACLASSALDSVRCEIHHCAHGQCYKSGLLDTGSVDEPMEDDQATQIWRPLPGNHNLGNSTTVAPSVKNPSPSLLSPNLEARSDSPFSTYFRPSPTPSTGTVLHTQRDGTPTPANPVRKPTPKANIKRESHRLSSSPTPGSPTPQPPPQSPTELGYSAEKIVLHRGNPSKKLTMEYLVRWKTHPMYPNGTVRWENLDTMEHLGRNEVSEYHRQKGLRTYAWMRYEYVLAKPALYDSD